jgi:serine/threonine protein kinase
MELLITSFRTFPYCISEIRKSIKRGITIDTVRARETYKLFQKPIIGNASFIDLKQLYMSEKSEVMLKANKIIETGDSNSFLLFSLKEMCYASESTIQQETKIHCFVDIEDFKDYGLTELECLSFGCLLCNKKASDKNFIVPSIYVPDFIPKSILGEGTFGLVLKGQDEKGNWFADKIMKKGIDINEVDISCRFKHPNILHAVKIGKDERNRLHVIYPLGEYTLNYHKFSSDHERYYFTYQICSAIAFFHKNKYYHCDIKPQNIIVFKNDDGTFYPVVSDFGWVFPIEFNQPICGSPGFASPQGWKQHPDKEPFNEPIDLYQSDLFSLGAVIYYIFFETLLIRYTSLESDYTNIFTTLKKTYETYYHEEDKKELLKYIQYMCSPSQVQRMKTYASIFSISYFKKQGWTRPIGGSIIDEKININCEIKVRDDMTIQKCLMLGYNFIDHFCSIIKAPILVKCIAFSIFCRCLEKELYIDSTITNKIRCCSVICSASCYIACNLSFNKILYKPFVVLNNNLFSEEECQYMVFKIVFSLNGILRVKTIYDVTKDVEKINSYFSKGLENCKLL